MNHQNSRVSTLLAVALYWIALPTFLYGVEEPESADVAATVQHDENGSRVGDAFTDPNNPVRKIFKGERLDLCSLKPPRSEIPSLSEIVSVNENPSDGKLNVLTPQLIDHFISAKLSQAGLRTSPEADRRTLIRRFSFDLIGLPPTEEEFRSFAEDSSPNAYKKLVDRLLDSPRYATP